MCVLVSVEVLTFEFCYGVCAQKTRMMTLVDGEKTLHIQPY